MPPPTTVAELIERINESRRQFDQAIARLTDAQLLEPRLAGDWTVKDTRAHMAFWDQRAITLIEKWKQEGVGPSAIDVDVMNEVTRMLCLAISPVKAAELAIFLADKIDCLIEDLNPEMVEAILAEGTTVKLNRADHRRTHLSEIERALQVKGR